MALLDIYEELHFLLTKNKELLEKKNFVGKTLQQKYFGNLEEKYYTKNSYSRASYIEATGLSRSSYENLKGLKECATTDVRNVVYAAFWLCVTYEEGKLLYLLWFNNQIMNEEEYLYWDSIFRILDKERAKLMNMTAIMRVMYIKEKIGK